MKLQRTATIGVPTALLVAVGSWLVAQVWATYQKVELHDYILRYHGLEKLDHGPP